MITMKFKRMKDIREDRELTQQQIASVIGVERSTYSGYEIGKDTIPLRKLILLSEYYKLSIDYIVGISSKNNYIPSDGNIDKIVVGKNLKQIRKEKNLKQKDIFKLLNTTSSTYSAYETGKVLIQTAFIYTIANKYGYSIDWIIGKTK